MPALAISNDPLSGAHFRALPAKVVLALALACVLLLLAAGGARAVILPAVTIDGPNEDIAGFGGVAMADDGTGGLVYLKRVEGVAHVFVSRYIAGSWQPPIRVDTEEPFAGSWPRIGAADGGELVVVWATPFATENSLPVDELLGATLGPGSSLFGPAMIIDPNVRNGTGTSPDLAMSSTGQADVVYRVVNETSKTIPLLRPGDVAEEVRTAHFNGQTWSRLGAVNRNVGISMRPPTALNAPRIAIGPTGNGVVVWQEPDISGVARIWARRLFGRTLDFVLPVSAASLGGAPISGDADAPTVAFSRLGQAEVAYRQTAGPGSPLPGPRIFLNTLPDGESADGSQFQGAAVVDTAVAGGAAAAVGPPSIDIDEKQDMRLIYDSNGTPRVIQGNDHGLSGAVSLGPAVVGQASASVMNPAGGGVSAWPSADAHGAQAVAVREDFPEGGVQTALVSGGSGGEVGDLGVGRSGLGDGLVAFQQGPLGHAAIVAAQVTAPPEQFVVNVPHSWIRPSQGFVSWLPATSAVGPLTYRVVVDGRAQPTPAGAFALHISPHALGNGGHRVQVLATDADGQATLTPPASVRVAARPPSVKVSVSRGRATVRIRITDAGPGVETHAVSISFGDGGTAGRRTTFSHRYRHAGIYVITVHVRDKLGNAGIIRHPVSVR
ncbi:MAG TPA: PKD domain-containing protein [Solirubrobacteraceae bacterium]|jgi:hypothetical protein